jgi:hypothetical protein
MYTMSWPERVATSEITWPRLDFSKANRCVQRVRGMCVCVGARQRASPMPWLSCDSTAQGTHHTHTTHTHHTHPTHAHHTRDTA